MPAIRWVLIDESQGAACSNGETLTPAALARIAEAVNLQIQQDYGPEFDSYPTIRSGSSPTDIQPGESVYALKRDIGAPGASAYHDIDGKGVPFSLCAVPTCDSLTSGPGAISVDVSHEMLEADRDPGCNKLLDDLNGSVHAQEECDAVEAQTYGKTLSDGTVAQVSNFLLEAWTIPSAPAPYDFMCKAGLPGAVSPPGPLQTAPANGANYQIVGAFSTSSEHQVFAAHHGGSVLEIMGNPRKKMHWASRSFRRLFGTHPVQLGQKGGEPRLWAHPFACEGLGRPLETSNPSFTKTEHDGLECSPDCPACDEAADAKPLEKPETPPSKL